MLRRASRLASPDVGEVRRTIFDEPVERDLDDASESGSGSDHKSS
jgi:hypothetical protein